MSDIWDQGPLGPGFFLFFPKEDVVINNGGAGRFHLSNELSWSPRINSIIQMRNGRFEDVQPKRPHKKLIKPKAKQSEFEIDYSLFDSKTKEVANFGKIRSSSLNLKDWKIMGISVPRPDR